MKMLTPLLLALVWALPAPARAEPIPVTCVTLPCIDFSATISSGVISYAGGESPLEGTGILIRAIRGFGTPQNPTLPVGPGLAVVNGNLAFTTGNFLGYDIVRGYRFDGGGTFRITGAVPEIGLNEVTTLAEGRFFSAAFRPGLAPTIVSVHGLDTKHETLATYFGFNPKTPFVFGGTGGGGPIVTAPPGPAEGLGRAFSVDVLGVDIPNSPVPEPTSVALFGSALAGLGARAWRSRRRR